MNGVIFDSSGSRKSAGSGSALGWAEAHAAEDRARRELIDARNQADALAYAVEKTVNESRDRLSPADTDRIEAAIRAARDAAKLDDAQAIRNATNELQKASHSMAEQLYKQSQAGDSRAGATVNAHGDIKEGEVVDA